MNRAIELHDSTLQEIVASGRDRLLRFRPAYIHESEGTPGTDSGEGFTQDVDIILGNARVIEAPVAFPATVTDGRVTIGGIESSNIIRLPLSEGRSVSFGATTDRGETVRIDADSISISMRGVSHYVEPFAGSTDV